MSILSVDNISPIGSGTSVTVNSAATLVLTNANSTGVITATSFVGSGANLTSLPSQVTISNNADNRIITGGSGTNLNGESTLTYNGSGTLEINDSGSSYTLRGAGVTKHEIAASASDNDLVIQNNKDQGNITSDIIFKGSGAGGGTVSEKMRITNTGVGIGTNSPTANALTLGGTAAAVICQNPSSGYGSNQGFYFGNGNGTIGYVWNYENDQIRFATNNTERMRIHANGAVTKPLQPSFGAYGNASWTTVNASSGGVPVIPNVSHNVGTHYNTSNGIFTAPVDGLYLIMFHTLVSTVDDSQSTDIRSFDMFFQKNGSNLTRHHQKRGYRNDGDVQNTMDMTCTEILSANDTINLYFYANSYSQRWYGAHTYFGVTLLS